MISIGTIGLIKGITTFDASKGARLATYAARCVENEILMYFRGQKKSAQDVSLSDYIETGTDGAALSLMDVVSEDGDLLEQVSSRESAEQLHWAIRSCLTEQEREVVVLRYGLNGKPPKRQREVAIITGNQQELCVQNRKAGAAKAAEGVGRVRDALVELQRADGESILSGQRGQNRRMLCAFYALKLCGRGRISAARSRMIDIELQLKSLEKI